MTRVYAAQYLDATSSSRLNRSWRTAAGGSFRAQDLAERSQSRPFLVQLVVRRGSSIDQAAWTPGRGCSLVDAVHLLPLRGLDHRPSARQAGPALTPGAINTPPRVASGQVQGRRVNPIPGSQPLRLPRRATVHPCASAGGLNGGSQLAWTVWPNGADIGRSSPTQRGGQPAVRSSTAESSAAACTQEAGTLTLRAERGRLADLGRSPPSRSPPRPGAGALDPDPARGRRDRGLTVPCSTRFQASTMLWRLPVHLFAGLGHCCELVIHRALPRRGHPWRQQIGPSRDRSLSVIAPLGIAG